MPQMWVVVLEARAFSRNGPRNGQKRRFRHFCKRVDEA
jgi:hypothetical protein